MNLGVFDNFFNRFIEDKTIFDVNIYSNEKEYIVEAFLAGVKKSDISISYENNMLTIAVKSSDTKWQNSIKNEFKGYVESRSFSLPQADETKSKCSYIDGKLLITMPKKDIVEKSHKYLTIE